MENRIYEVLIAMLPEIQAMVPRNKGRLAESIKIRQTSTGWQLYIDDGGMTKAQWEEQYPEGAEITDSPVGVAPYASELNEYRPFWRRVAFMIRDRLVYELGVPQPTKYESRG